MCVCLCVCCLSVTTDVEFYVNRPIRLALPTVAGRPICTLIGLS